MTLAEAVKNLKLASRRYAKRQLTWFSRDERVNWIDIDTTKDVLSEASKIIERKVRLEQNSQDS